MKFFSNIATATPSTAISKTRFLINLLYFFCLVGIMISPGCSSPQKKTPEAPKPPVAKPIELPAPVPIPGEPYSNPEISNEKTNTPSKSINYLIAGLDKFGAPDSIIVAAFDNNSKTFRLLSLPRDTRVTVPDFSNPKKLRNAFKGNDRFVKTVENLLGIEIKGYIIVNIPSAEKIIDSMGGVTIEVVKPLKYVDRAQALLIDIPAGTQHLNGKNAVDYARFRNDSQGDLGRVQRQQKLLKALASSAVSAEILPKLPEVIKTILENPVIKSNITIEDAINIAKTLSADTATGISGITLPGEAKYIDGSSYIVPAQDDIEKIKHDFFGL